MMIHDNVLSIEGSARALGHASQQLGMILVANGKLTLSDVERITDLQGKGGIRFGEAALTLGLLQEEDLQAALAQQYDLPQVSRTGSGVSTELVTAYLPHHPCAEEMRALRTQLLIRWFEAAIDRRMLAIVSPGSGDGRSYFSANLAVVFSQLGLRTLLIDADLRKPRQHSIFNVPDRVGLAAVLAERADASAAVPVKGFSNLFLLPAGAPPPNPQELLSRPRMAHLMNDLGGKFDIILLDTSAARHYADARSVAFRAGNAVVLARKNLTRVADTGAMVRDLNDAGTRVVGTIINSFPG